RDWDLLCFEGDRERRVDVSSSRSDQQWRRDEARATPRVSASCSADCQSGSRPGKTPARGPWSACALAPPARECQRAPRCFLQQGKVKGHQLADFAVIAILVLRGVR